MESTSLSAEATLHRTRLLLGLTSGGAVVEWADARILELPTSPSALTDLSLTPPNDLSALRHALLPLCETPESPEVIEAVLGDVARDLVAQRRSVKDTANVLRQMRLMLPLPTAVDSQLDSMIDTLMLAEAGIGASLADAELAVRDWAHSYVDSTAQPGSHR